MVYMKKLSALFVLLACGSCGGGSVTCPEINFSTSGYESDYVCSEEEGCDFSHLTDEELEEALCSTYGDYAMWYAEWERAEREAQRIWVHDQLSFRQHKKRAACAASEACIYEARLRMLKAEAEKREGVEG
jgi:hypothetical protein